MCRPPQASRRGPELLRLATYSKRRLFPLSPSRFDAEAEAAAVEAGERAPMASTRLFSGLPPKRLRARHFLYSSFAGEAFTSCSRPVLKDDSTSKELMSMDMEPRNGMKRSCGGGEGTRRVRGVAAGSGGVAGTSAGFPTTGLEDRGTYRRRRVFSGVCASVGVSDINGCPDIAASATREAVPGSRLGVLDGALVL